MQFHFFEQLNLNQFARLLAGLILLAVAGFATAHASFAAPPADSGAVQISILRVLENGDISPQIPPLMVGKRLTVTVTADDVPPPGLFGGQFELHFDPAVLRVVENSLQPGPAMNPALVVQADVDATAGRVLFAASRQGDVDNLTGAVRLATVAFEAIAATGPQSTTLTLNAVALGRRGGESLPVAATAPLAFRVTDTNDTPAPVILSGRILLEGSPNPSGNVTVTAKNADGAEFTLAVDASGNFLFDDLPPGEYRISARSPGFLAATCTEVLHAAPGPTSLEPTTLLAGDVDGDGDISIADAVSLGAALGNTTPQPATDLNRDDRVDVLDVILLAANFGQTAANNLWFCHPPTQ